MEQIVIQGEGLVLKQLLLKDAEPLFLLIDRNRSHLSQYGEPTAAKYPNLSAMHKSIVDPPQLNRLRFGIWDGSVLVGSINITPDKENTNCAEIGYWLGAKFVGKGYATRATKALVAYAFADMGIELIYGIVDSRNNPSIRVLERIGFQKDVPLGSKKVKYILQKAVR